MGLNIGSQFIYDTIRSYLKRETKPTIEGLQRELASRLDVENANVRAEKIIQFLAKTGDIRISGSQVYASDSIFFKSAKNTKFSLRDNSSTITSKSSIHVGENAQIAGQGGQV